MTISSPTRAHQVFFNYRGEQLRYNFISHLIDAFERHKIKFIIDIYEQRGKDLKDLFVRIEESRIALAIFSTRYAESSWCMDELVKMKKLADQGKLIVIPIFYKVKAQDVRGQKGEFGENFLNLAKSSSGDQIKKWKEALECISDKMGLSFRDRSSEADFVKQIVKEVQRIIAAIGSKEDKNNFVVNGENFRIAISVVCLLKLNHQMLGPRHERDEVVPGDSQEAWETFPPRSLGIIHFITMLIDSKSKLVFRKFMVYYFIGLGNSLLV